MLSSSLQAGIEQHSLVTSRLRGERLYRDQQRKSVKRNIETMTDRRTLETEKSYERLIERFCAWARNRSDVRAAIVVGSRARVDHAADEWADLDIIMVTTDPEHYVSTSDWINNIGRPLLTFIEPTSAGDEKERRVLFEGMLDVDFAIIPQEKAKRLLESGTGPQGVAQIANLFGRGMRVLIDKEEIEDQLQALIASIEKAPASSPTQDEFLEMVNDFLYHAVFTAKHLQRGELWWTATCLDCYMQHLLLRMIEWHAFATNDWKYDIWFRGRFLEEWAHPQAVKELHNTFAHYDSDDIKRALLAAIDLFHWLAAETAAKLKYRYPEKADETVTRWIRKCFSEIDKQRL